MTQAKTVKKQILASKIAYKRSLNNEERLERELQRFFYKLKKEVLRALDQYWSDTLLLQGQVNLIVEPVHEAHKDYYELLEKYIKREYRLGKVEGKRLVEIANSRAKTAHKSEKIPFKPYLKNRNDLFGTLPSAEERLLNKTFVASERTLSRVDSQISQILTDGYRSGEGINKVANDLTQRFDQLTTWESKRIARTEIHNAHNTAVMDSYEEYGVEYTMWMCANDDRVRDSHIEIDGEIIPMGGEYSNGLKYPGDTDGPIEEWINCRCANAPFNIPYGYMAPPFSPFRESDLVKIETKPQVTEPEPVNEPTEEQIKENLTPKEQRQLEGISQQIEDLEGYLKRPDATADQLKVWNEQIQHKKKIVEELRNKALGQAKVEPTPTIKEPSEPIKIRNDTLTTFKQETPLNDFDKVTEWADKRCKGKIEWGYKFDTRNGKLVGEEFRGSKATIKIEDNGKNIGSIHVHTDAVMSFPSDGDIIGYRSMAEQDHYIISRKEIWYVHAEENLGMMGRLTQADIKMVYNKSISEGNAAVEELMRSGKIGLDEKSIKEAADKEIGDRLLKEFSQQKWKDKGLEVRRAYR